MGKKLQNCFAENNYSRPLFASLIVANFSFVKSIIKNTFKDKANKKS